MDKSKTPSSPLPVIYDKMSLMIWRFSLFFIPLLFSPLPAIAACGDRAADGVDWQRCYFDGLDAPGQHVPNGNLRDASFMRANLQDSHFQAIDGMRAKFFSARLERSRFDDAHLSQADFSKANATEASFVRTDLRRAKFFRAILTNADFSDAKITGTDFTGAILDGAIWIDGTTRCAPGSVGRCR